MNSGEMAKGGIELGRRRLDLDWIRIGAFLLLILYHVGMLYVPWEWHLKSPRIVDWLQPVMILTNPWRLTLLFVVTGAATRFMVDKTSTTRFLGTRAVRLLPPLLFAMVAIVPVQTWLQVAQSTGASPQPFAGFWMRYITGTGGWMWNGAPLDTPTWNHMWFVVYVLAYTMVLALIIAVAPGATAVLQRSGERLLGGFGLLFWPTLFLTLVRNVVAPSFPETHAFVGDWTVHLQSAVAFLFGYLFAKSDGLWAAIVSWRWRMACLAATSYLIYAAALCAWIAGAIPGETARPVIDLVFGLDQWTWMAAIMGFARVHLSEADNPARRYLTEAIFPFYIVHQTVIIVLAWALIPYRLPLALEAIVIVVVTAMGCVATFEVVRRVSWLRPLFGLKRAV